MRGPCASSTATPISRVPGSMARILADALDGIVKVLRNRIKPLLEGQEKVLDCSGEAHRSRRKRQHQRDSCGDLLYPPKTALGANDAPDPQEKDRRYSAQYPL